MRRRTVSAKKLGAAALFGATLLAGCGNSTSSKATSATVDQAIKSGVKEAISSQASTTAPARAGLADKSSNTAPGVAPGAVAPATNAGGSLASTSGTAPATLAPPALQPTDIGRSIIFSAAIAVEAKDVGAAGTEAMQVIASFGGFLFGQQAVSEPAPRQVLTFKVLPKDFQPALGRLGGLGKLVDQKVSTDDVTERVVDLESRVRTSEASVLRLREFLQNATNLDVVARLENELLQRETQLEQLKGQLRTVQAQVDLATIQLTLTQTTPPGPAAKVRVSGYLDDKGEAACPGDNRAETTEGETWTFCYEVDNVGSIALSEVKLDDPGLSLDPSDMKLLSGDPNRLEPGQRVVFAATKKIEIGNNIRPRLRAVPLGARNETVRSDIKVDFDEFRFTIKADDSLPGFFDALKGGWRALLSIGSVVLVIVGGLLPFVWVPLVLWFGFRWWRRRHPKQVRPAPQPWQPTNTGTTSTVASTNPLNPVNPTQPAPVGETPVSAHAGDQAP